jgi:uncharacterized protein YbaP (TraB family)
METKHTPGPWELDGPTTAHVTDEDYHAIRAGCGFWAIAKDQREPGFSITGHMSAADARLMSVAPDLLEALNESNDVLVAAFGNVSNPDDAAGWSDPDAFEVYLRNCAAIAKATRGVA